jgi:hypothetical protein
MDAHRILADSPNHLPLLCLLPNPHTLETNDEVWRQIASLGEHGILWTCSLGIQEALTMSVLAHS